MANVGFSVPKFFYNPDPVQEPKPRPARRVRHGRRQTARRSRALDSALAARASRTTQFWYSTTHSTSLLLHLTPLQRGTVGVKNPSADDECALLSHRRRWHVGCKWFDRCNLSRHRNPQVQPEQFQRGYPRIRCVRFSREQPLRRLGSYPPTATGTLRPALIQSVEWGEPSSWECSWCGASSASRRLPTSSRSTATKPPPHMTVTDFAKLRGLSMS